MDKLLAISYLCLCNIAIAQHDTSFSTIKLQGEWSFHIKQEKVYLSDCWAHYSFSNDTIEINHGSTGEHIYVEIGTFIIQGDSIKVVPFERLTISGNTGFPISHYKNNHSPHYLPIEHFFREQEDKEYLSDGKIQITFNDCFSHLRKTKETVFIDPNRISLLIRDRKPQSTDY
jgi:hypothetical protein